MIPEGNPSNQGFRLGGLSAQQRRRQGTRSEAPSPQGLMGAFVCFPRLTSLVNNGSKKRILKPAARAGGRTVPSHNLSCTACHSYLGTQLQVKACHHTPKKLWNQIHVHRASHCSLNFADAVRATQIGRAVSQPSGGIERWRRLVKSGGLQSRV